MSVELATRDHLLSTGAVTSIVGARIYQLKLPQTATYPAIRLQLLNKTNGHHLRGPDGSNKSFLQIDSYASELAAGDPYLAASHLADAIEDALDGKVFLAGSPAPIRVTGAFQRSKKPQYEPPELRLVRWMQEFEIWWKPN